jgi:hypothetical protein
MLFVLALIVVNIVVMVAAQLGPDCRGKQGSCKLCVAETGCEYCFVKEANAGFCKRANQDCPVKQAVVFSTLSQCDATTAPKPPPSFDDFPTSSLGLLAGGSTIAIPIVVVGLFLCGCMCVMRGNSF